MNILLEQFSKKIGRSDFAIRYIPTAIIVFFITGGSWNSNLSSLEGIVLIAAGFYAILLAVQRLNDFGSSRWYVLLSLIPIVNVIFGVALLSRKGRAAPAIVQIHKTSEEVKIPTNIEHGDIKYCMHCGGKHSKDTKFCSSCGKSFL